MVVICRIDLDSIKIEQLELLVAQKIVCLNDARQAKCVLAMSEYQQILWFRKMQSIRDQGFMKQTS